MTENTITKYLGERIPRYTSYPTAPNFSEAVGAETYGEWLAELPSRARLSLYLHVPFCQTLCWYCGCNTTITRHRDPIVRYVRLLEREIDRVASLLGSHRVAHIHWGGGTPTIVGPATFLAVTGLLRERFAIEAGAEIAVEIDPRRLDAAMASALGRSGVTRASLGIQTFDPVVQRAIARVQTLEATRSCADLLRRAGITALNFDLVYGLPRQTVASCEESVAAAITLNPARVSVFGYAHVPAMKRHQRVIDTATLPGGEERLRQEQAIGLALTRAGYRRIGLDHYARPEDPLSIAELRGTLRRNFQGYTDDPADALIGLGASAISQLPQGYAQNAAAIADWSERIGAGGLATVRGVALTPEDRLRADIIERLMCDFRVDVGAMLLRHRFPSGTLAAELAALEPVIADGLAKIDGSTITIPDRSRALVRRVACLFDAYLKPRAERHAVAV